MTTALIRSLAWAAMTVAAVAQQDGNPPQPPPVPNYSASSSALMAVAAMPDVHRELGLTDGEAQQLMQALRGIDPQRVALQTPEERQRRAEQFALQMEETRKKMHEAIQTALTAAQLQRLRELELQRIGGRALLQPAVAEELQLTAEQQQQIQPLMEEFVRSGSRNAEPRTPAESRARVEKYNMDLIAVLTTEQRRQWEKMQGEPFALPQNLSPIRELVLVPKVQQELGLPEADAAKLTQTLEELQRQRFQNLRPPRAEEDPDRRFAESRKRFDRTVETLRSSLTVAQWNRLQELSLQRQGVEALYHPAVANALGLTPEQRARVRDLRRRPLGNGPVEATNPESEDVLSRREKRMSDLLDILTPEQKAAWEKLQGRKFNFRRRPSEKAETRGG